MNDNPYLIERDRIFIEKCRDIINRQKRLDKVFDNFETNVNLWEKEKTVFKMNKSQRKEEILDLWERFKKLEKKTRI